jgi:hypothetical protein
MQSKTRPKMSGEAAYELIFNLIPHQVGAAVLRENGACILYSIRKKLLPQGACAHTLNAMIKRKPFSSFIQNAKHQIFIN